MRRRARGFGAGRRLLVLVFAAGLFSWACVGPPRPVVYESNRELKPGPGLFSGGDGVFTIYGTSADSGAATSGKAPDPEDPGSTASSSRTP